MSKNIQAFEALPDPEPLDFVFDPQEELKRDYARLCEEVESGFLTHEEASEIYDLMREHYGLS